MAKNYNYVAIKIKSIDVTLSRNSVTIGYATHHQFSVSGRQHKEVIKQDHNSYYFIIYCAGNNSC